MKSESESETLWKESDVFYDAILYCSGDCMDRISEVIFNVVMLSGVAFGWIPVLVLGLINSKSDAAGNNAMTTGNNVSAAGGGGGNISNLAMIIGGSIWCFIASVACLGCGAPPHVSRSFCSTGKKGVPVNIIKNFPRMLL
jgi:hypothetical protein